MQYASPAAVVESLRGHPHVAALTAQVHASALAAAAARDAAFPAGSGLGELTPEQTRTELGDLTVLFQQGASTREERALVAALLALGAAPDGTDAGPLVWLATHGTVDAWCMLDAARGAAAARTWEALAAVVVDPATAGLGRAEAVVAAAALRASESDGGRRATASAAERTDDPTLRAVLLAGEREPARSLQGNLEPPPPAGYKLVLLAVTGLLLLLRGARLLARVGLGLRRPAEVRVDADGMRLSVRTELLGRVLRRREVVIPLDAIARVTREVRYARAGLYAGLAALSVGCYLGASLFADGVRVPGGSLPLLGLAGLLVLGGVALDFVLSTFADSRRGKCRLVVSPRRGRAWCVGGLEPHRADEMLRALAEATRPRPL
jgi:hypothetical protein